MINHLLMFISHILRDETGKKLSKSLAPDPFDLFEEYGTDAVRFGIMYGSKI